MTIETDLIRHYGEVRRRCYGEPERLAAPIVATLPPLVFVPSQPVYSNGWRGICQEVADKHGVPTARIFDRVRGDKLVRWEAWWRVRREIGASYPILGRWFDRDHTTILYGVRQYEVARRR